MATGCASHSPTLRLPERSWCALSGARARTATPLTGAPCAQYAPAFLDASGGLGGPPSSLLVQPLLPGSFLVLFAPSSDAFGQKTRAWTAALGDKLSAL